MEKAKLTLRFADTVPSTFEALERVVDELMELAREAGCDGEHLEREKTDHTLHFDVTIGRRDRGLTNRTFAIIFST
jgi:hypothetical protein